MAPSSSLRKSDEPQLTPALLDEVIGYYRAHQAEIDAELRAEDEAEADRDHSA